MEPKIWGPPAWIFLHSITFQYPEYPTDIEKQKYYTFFHSLKNVLPCPNCREHYQINFDKLQIDLESRKGLIEWLIDLHNEVNMKNGKKVLTYNEVYQKYNGLYENEKGTNIYIKIILIQLIIVFSCYYFKNYILKK